MTKIETIVIDDGNDDTLVLGRTPITPPPSMPQSVNAQPPQILHRTPSVQSISFNGSGCFSKRRKVAQVTDPKLLGASTWNFDAKVRSREHTLSIDTDGRGVSPASMPEQPDTPTPSQRLKKIKMVNTDFEDSGLETSSSPPQAKFDQIEIKKRDNKERMRFDSSGLHIFQTNSNLQKVTQSSHALCVTSSRNPSALTERPRNSLKFDFNGLPLAHASSTPAIYSNASRESEGETGSHAISSAFNILKLDGQDIDTSDLSGGRRRSSALSSIYETPYGWQRSSSIARQAADIPISDFVKHLSIHDDRPLYDRESEVQSSFHTEACPPSSTIRIQSLVVIGEKKREGLSLSQPILLDDEESEWGTERETKQLMKKIEAAEFVDLRHGSLGSIVRSVETDEDEMGDTSFSANRSPRGRAGSTPEDMDSDFDMCVDEDDGPRTPSETNGSAGVYGCGNSFFGVQSNMGCPEFSTPTTNLLRKASRNPVDRDIAKHSEPKAPNILKSHKQNLFVTSSDADDTAFSGDESQIEVSTPSSSGRKRKRGGSHFFIENLGDSTFMPSSDAERNSSAKTEGSVELLDDDSDEENDEALQEMKMEEMMGDMGLSDDEVEDVTPRRKASVIDLESQINVLSEGEVEFLREREVQKAGEKSRRSAMVALRNPPIVYPLLELESYAHHHKLERGTFIEVGHLDPTDLTFLLVKHIIKNTATGQIMLRGHEFRRTRVMHGVIERKINELCRILVVDQDDARPWSEQGMVEIPVEHVMAHMPPRELVVTNRVFGKQRGGVTWRQSPKCRGWNDMKKRERERWIEKSGLLSARWEQVTIWQDGRSRIDMRETVPSRIYRLISEDDEDIKGPFSKYSCRLMREDWRGEGVTTRGGGWWIGLPKQPKGYFTFDSMGQVVKFVSPSSTRPLGQATGRVPSRPSTASRRGSKYIQPTTTYEIDLTDDDQSPHCRSLSRSVSYHRLLTVSLTQTMSIDLTTTIDDISPDGKFQAGGSHVRFSISRGSQGYIKRRPGQMYTYGDSFCGAGGATRGAQMAGLKVLFGFDKWNTACESWHMNFPQAAIYEMDAQEFSTSPYVLRRYCDILHMSPPCQYFSPAHTVEGKDDETNSAALFSCSEILKACRPRLATLEQTYGITHGEFRHWFNRLINQFTENGYSVVYKICKLERWGLPQRRRRLIIIAAAPGEKLPAIPEYTHIAVPPHEHSHFLPLASLKSACSRIPHNALNHNPHDQNLHFSHRRKPWDGDSICPRAMTTHGGFNYHWDGLRKFTLREFACIQGFPIEHRFANVHVMRLIGNAVPPLVAKVLFEHCRRSLEETDGVGKEVVEIDD